MIQAVFIEVQCGQERVSVNVLEISSYGGTYSYSTGHQTRIKMRNGDEFLASLSYEEFVGKIEQAVAAMAGKR